MSDAAGQTFTSHVDRFHAIVIGLLALISAVCIVAGIGYVASTGNLAKAGVFVSGCFPLVLIALFFYPARYTLADDHLAIRMGAMTKKIPYADIAGAHPERSTSPAEGLSFDRIHLAGTDGSVKARISPADKDGFLHQLAARAEHLRYAGGRVTSDANVA